MKLNVRVLSLFPILVFVTSLRPAQAQVTAAISGHVEDGSGRDVSDATVTVKNLETGAIRLVTTDTAGNFRILSLALGQQEVKVEKAGFKVAVRTGINLEVGQDAVVSLRLDLGEIAQAVTVSGDAPLV